MRKGILFLTLRIFSATGGIEKVCKVVCKALQDIIESEKEQTLKVLSMYDSNGDADAKYISPGLFAGFGQMKFSFARAAIKEGLKSRIIILSHVNLLSIGYIIKLLSPGTKLVLFAHGIEVWKPLSGLRRKMLKKCDSVLAVSHFTKNKMTELYGLGEDRITVLNNCIDPFLPEPLSTGKDSLLQKRYHFNNGETVLMTLTRLSSKELYKGYDHVLFALSDLKNKYPSIRYLIVGWYDDAEKERLDYIIDQLSLQQYVIFTGFIPDAELATHFSIADMYVMPSKKEGFGIVFIEAMHYGLPVIGGNKDGSVDALCNGKLGILVNPDSQDEINEAIEKIILNRSHYIPDKVLLKQCFSYEVYRNKLSGFLKKLVVAGWLYLPVLQSVSKTFNEY